MALGNERKPEFRVSESGFSISYVSLFCFLGELIWFLDSYFSLLQNEDVTSQA